MDVASGTAPDQHNNTTSTANTINHIQPLPETPKQYFEALSNFSALLKTNFENPNLWLKFALTLSLSKESPHGALQIFRECMRIQPSDPLPAMLAAKLLLEDLDDPVEGLELAKDAISRCELLDKQQQQQQQQKHSSTSSSSSMSSSTEGDDTKNDINHNHGHNHVADSNHNNNHEITNQIRLDAPPTKVPLYKRVKPLLSKCYLLASIMHGYMYEREPESIKQFKTDNLKSSIRFLSLALESNPDDYLAHFHKALHEARNRSYTEALDCLRIGIKLNPKHVPSIQLLILTLSGLKLNQEALNLCESTLCDYKDDLMLLYIKCHLEQRLVGKHGYKAALHTTQHMLRCIRKTKMRAKSSSTNLSTPQHSATDPKTPIVIETDQKQTMNLFSTDLTDRARSEKFISDELSIWLLVAEIFIKIGSLSDAESCVDEGSMQSDGALSHRIMYTRGLIAKAKNNLMEAKSYFQSCLALCPRHAEGLQQLAHVYFLLGNHTTAEKFLKDSLDIDSDNHKTWHYLSLVFIEQNQHDKASECVKKSSNLEESSPVIPLSAVSRLTLV